MEEPSSEYCLQEVLDTSSWHEFTMTQKILLASVVQSQLRSVYDWAHGRSQNDPVSIQVELVSRPSAHPLREVQEKE